MQTDLKLRVNNISVSPQTYNILSVFESSVRYSSYKNHLIQL